MQNRFGRGLLIGLIGAALCWMAGPALAMSPEQDAAIDLLRRDSPQRAGEIRAGLDRIDRSDASEDEKRRQRERFLDEQLEKARTDVGERTDTFRLIRDMKQRDDGTPTRDRNLVVFEELQKKLDEQVETRRRQQAFVNVIKRGNRRLGDEVETELRRIDSDPNLSAGEVLRQKKAWLASRGDQLYDAAAEARAQGRRGAAEGMQRAAQALYFFRVFLDGDPQEDAEENEYAEMGRDLFRAYLLEYQRLGGKVRVPIPDLNPPEATPSRAPRRIGDARMPGGTGAPPGDGVEPVEYVRVCDVHEAGFYYIPGTEICLRVGGYVRAKTHFIGDRMGLGVVVNPPDDSFFLRPDDSLTGWGLGGGFVLGSPNWRHSVDFGYSSASGTFEAEKPDGGDVIGYVPGNSADGPGSSFGTSGFNAFSNLDYQRFSASYSALRPYADLSKADGGIRYSGGLTVSFEGFELEHEGRLELTSAPDDFYVDVDQRHTGWSVGAGPKFNMRVPLGDGISFIGSADVQAVMRQSSLTSFEDFCNVCGGSPTEISSVEDSKTSLGVQASASGAIAFKLPNDWRFKVSGGVIVGNFHVIDTRLNPDDDDTHIADDWGFEWNAGLRIERVW